MFQNKKIFILGMARSGYEVAKLLVSYGNDVLVVDGKEQEKEKVEELEKLGVKVAITNNQIDLLDETYDVMVKNPGIKYDNPLVLKARKLNIEVVNELEVAYSLLDKKVNIIGVTGSNGKTTTVTLIKEFLSKEFKNVFLCGNIGLPLSAILKDIKDNDILVIEISDHQLCDMYKFKTNISVLLNISETHIDFHDSYERYKQMKKRIFNNHNDDIAILNKENLEVINLAKDINDQKKYFSSKQEANCYLLNDKIIYNNETVVDIKDIKLKGIHNYENIMAAILVVKEFGIKNTSIKEVLSEFVGVEHRIEFVRELNGVKYYNDSKSTNNKATMTALSSFVEPIILLMGGLDRNIPFDDLKPYMKNVKKIECFGETKEKIAALASSLNIEYKIFDTMDLAIKDAYQSSIKGDIVLLSPACASWDQYESFEKRGEEFKHIVNEFK